MDAPCGTSTRCARQVQRVNRIGQTSFAAVGARRFNSRFARHGGGLPAFGDVRADP